MNTGRHARTKKGPTAETRSLRRKKDDQYSAFSKKVWRICKLLFSNGPCARYTGRSQGRNLCVLPRLFEILLVAAGLIRVHLWFH